MKNLVFIIPIAVTSGQSQGIGIMNIIPVLVLVLEKEPVCCVLQEDKAKHSAAQGVLHASCMIPLAQEMLKQHPLSTEQPHNAQRESGTPLPDCRIGPQCKVPELFLHCALQKYISYFSCLILYLHLI